MKIGFIGTGVMGTGIINNLLKNNEEVIVFNRTQSHARTVLANGARWSDSPAELARQSDIVFTMVGFPVDVEKIYFGDDGLLANSHAGQYFIDMTTSKPTLAKKIAKAGIKHGIHILDAPVSGGDVGAQNGTLTVMVGGDQADLDVLRPLFNCFAASVQYFGDAGSGQNAKIANQIMIAGTMLGMSEAFVYAKAAQLDLQSVMETLQSGAAENFSLGTYGPRILQDDYTPGFFAKHFLKDLRIALEEARQMGIKVPMTREATNLYEKLVNSGCGDDGTQALVKLWWGEKVK